LASHPPPRPPAWQEALSSRLFRWLGPRLGRVELPEPPLGLAPFEQVTVPRSRGRGTLAGTWYPAGGAAPPRGAVLLMPPWMVWGRTYFHRRGRIPRLREAGYHALAVDFPGFGGSGPPAGFFDRPVSDALDELGRLAPGLPRFVWGVSSGGFWAHMVLSGGERAAAAFFEDVSPHLFEWGRREVPWALPGYALFETVFRSSYRYLDLRDHAPALRLGAVAYAAGGEDPGIPEADTRRLAALAGGECLIVPGAGHLAAIKLAGEAVIDLALDTFARGAAAGRASCA
jgi:pimeloyl-ACP methyl ester carboxylesterase